MSQFKPKFVLSKYCHGVPYDLPAGADEPLGNVTLEPYVRDTRKPLPVALHTRTHRLPSLTAEPLKPAVVFSTQDTQTDPVLVSAVPAADAPYQPYRRSEAAELLLDKIRLQREVHALELRAEELRLACEKLALEQQNAEERRLACEKLALEQQNAEERRLAQEQMLLEQQNAEERRLAEEKTIREQHARAEERRLAEEKVVLQQRRLQRERETRPKLPQLAREQPARPARPARPAQAARPAQPAQPARPAARTRTYDLARK